MEESEGRTIRIKPTASIERASKAPLVTAEFWQKNDSGSAR
jgi:hypothetical protein